MPLAPSEAECAPLTWNMALHFVRSLIQYGVLRVATADNEVIEQRARSRSRALGALICVEGSKGSTNDDTHCILISLSRRQRRARTRHTDQPADFGNNPCAVARPALSNDVVNSKGLVGVAFPTSMARADTPYTRPGKKSAPSPIFDCVERARDGHSSDSQDITTTAQTSAAQSDIWRKRPDFCCRALTARPVRRARCLSDAARSANIRRHSLHSDLTFPTSTACSDTPHTKTERKSALFGPPIPNLSVCVAHSSNSQDITTTAQTIHAYVDIWRKRPEPWCPRTQRAAGSLCSGVCRCCEPSKHSTTLTAL
jgi:hypothetical protein